MNSGKTLLMVKYGFFNFLRGRTIYSNFGLNFPHKLINSDFLLYIGKEQPSLDNCCFLLDELWLYLGDSRNSMSENNKLLSYFMLQSSKDMNLEIFITAQNVSQNDKRIKQNFHKLSYCSRFLRNEKGKFVKLSEDKRFLEKEKQERLYIEEKLFFNHYGGLKMKGKPLYHKANLWFGLYDTQQKIKSEIK